MFKKEAKKRIRVEIKLTITIVVSVSVFVLAWVRRGVCFPPFFVVTCNLYCLLTMNFAQIPYSVVAMYTAFVDEKGVGEIAGTWPAILAKSSMLWTPVTCIFTNQNIRSKVFASYTSKSSTLFVSKRALNPSKDFSKNAVNTIAPPHRAKTAKGI
jgi:hypothetical protein